MTFMSACNQSWSDIVNIKKKNDNTYRNDRQRKLLHFETNHYPFTAAHAVKGVGR